MLRTACNTPGDTASVHSVEQVKRWLHRCNSSHPQCGLIDQEVELPTRLIDVESGLRLIEAAGRRGRYVCLSHCWGEQDATSSGNTFRTTKKNLESSLE